MTAAESNREAATYDMLGMIEDHPIDFTWGGQTFEGTTGGLVTTKQLMSGGLLADYDLQIATSLYKRSAPGVNDLIHRFPSQNASLPDEGDAITTGGVTYQVSRAQLDDYRAGIQLDLVTEHK